MHKLSREQQYEKYDISHAYGDFFEMISDDHINFNHRFNFRKDCYTVISDVLDFDAFCEKYKTPKNCSVCYDFNYKTQIPNKNGDVVSDIVKDAVRIEFTSTKHYEEKFNRFVVILLKDINNNLKISQNYPIKFKSVRDFFRFIDNDKEGLFTETHDSYKHLYMFNKSFEDFLKMFKFSRTLDLSSILFEKNRILMRFEYYPCLIIVFKDSFIKQLMLNKMNNLIHHEESIQTKSENDRIEICTLNQLEKALSKDKNFKCSTEKHGNIYLESFEKFVSRYKLYEELKVTSDCSRKYPAIVIWDESVGRIIEFINEKRSLSNDDLNRLKPSFIETETKSETETKDNKILISSKEEFFSVLSKDSNFEHGNYMDFKNTDTYHGTTDEFLNKYTISDNLRSVVHSDTLAPNIVMWDNDNVCFSILCSKKPPYWFKM